MLLRPLLLVFLCSLWLDSPAAGAPPYVDPIDLRDVFFEARQPVNAKDMDPPSAELSEALGVLKRSRKVLVFVSGYADFSEGSALECQSISERRALLVYDWLLAHGVEATQLTGHKGFGTSHPIDFDDTEAHRRHNRRVELNVQ